MAFPVYVKETRRAVSGAITALTQVEGKLTLESDNRAKEIRSMLNEISGSAWNQFRAAYVGFQHDPCNINLNDSLKDIRDKEDRLQAANITLKELPNLVSSGASDAVVIKLLEESLGSLMGRKIVEPIFGEDAAAVVNAWQRNPR